jgi:hypothetical protein
MGILGIRGQQISSDVNRSQKLADRLFCRKGPSHNTPRTMDEGNARGPLRCGVPRDTRSGGWVWGINQFHISTARSICEARDKRGIEYTRRHVDLPPAFGYIPIIETSVKRIRFKRIEIEYNSQSSRHSSQ